MLNEIEKIPQALETTLKSFVEKGGNVVVIPSNENTASDLSHFLNTFGKIQIGSLQNNTKLVTKIAFQNELFSSVFEKKVVNFQYPFTKSAFEIRATAPPILSYEDQSVFLTELKNQIASVYVFSAPINKVNSNFQNSPLIVPVFYKMAQNSANTGVNALVIGNNKPFLIDTTLSKDEIVNVKNSAEKFIPTQQIMNNKVLLSFHENPTIAGNFGIYKQEEFLQNISFNFDRTEGNLNLYNAALLSDFTVINSVDAVFNTLQTDRSNNEIWRLFVILTLLFLVIEVFIQKLVK